MPASNSLTEEDRERLEALRSATEAILNGSQPTQSNSITSLNNVTNPLLLSQNAQGASPCRRLFILLLLFDIIFTGLFWIFTLIVTGDDLITKIMTSIRHYNVKTSMFDTIILSAARLAMGVFFYGICSIKIRFPISLTTAGSSAFLIAKVILFQWQVVHSIMFNIALVLISFFLTWGEHWYLDIKVIPSENLSKPFVIYPSDERTPLLSNDRVQRYVDNQYQPSCYSFYSPLGSPNDSEDEIESNSGVFIPKKLKKKRPVTLEEHQYVELGKDTLQKAWSILNSMDWKLEKKLNDDTVHYKSHGGRKIFKLTGHVPLPPKLLLEELYYRIEKVPSWNPTLKECRSLQTIDAHTDISYQVCAEAAGGLVSVRDFVTLRHWGLVDDVFATSGVSIQYPEMPPQKDKVRGENRVGGWFMHPIPGDPDSCEFQWLLDSNIKGWFPGSIVEGAMCKAQFDYISYLRKYANSLYEDGTYSAWLRREGN